MIFLIAPKTKVINEHFNKPVINEKINFSLPHCIF